MNFLDRKKMNLPTTNVADLFEDYGNAATARSIEGKLMRFSKGTIPPARKRRKFRLASALSPAWTCSSSDMSYWQNNLPVEEWMGLLAEGFVPPKRYELGNLDKALWSGTAKASRAIRASSRII